MKRLVDVKNVSAAKVVLRIPELRYRRVWERPGTVIKIDFSVLEEAIYKKGVRKLFTDGFLAISDQDVLFDLGLINDKKEKLVPIADTKEMVKMVTEGTVEELEEVLKNSPKEYAETLARIAQSHKVLNFDKNKLFIKYAEYDVIKGVQLNESVKQEWFYGNFL